jgi:hypothetical protein
MRNNSMFSSHPWRTRTREFAVHLAQLPLGERKKVEAAERRFIAHREAPFSPHRRVVQDFCSSMVGAHEALDTEQEPC